MRQIILLTAIVLVGQVLAHPHPHPHPRDGDDDDTHEHPQAPERRQRKRPELARNRGGGTELTERQLRKLRRQNAADRAEAMEGAVPEVDHEEVDPESLVTMPVPREPVYYEMDMELDSRELMNYHIMVKR